MPAQNGRIANECPKWAVPARHWAWRAGVTLCVTFWGGVIAALVA